MNQPGAPANRAGNPAPGIAGTDNSGPTGIASNNARLIGRDPDTASSPNPNANSTARAP